MLTRCEEILMCCDMRHYSYMCGARPTCFIMFCAMRRRLCLVRVHPELTNVFLLVSCCIELRTSCGGCTMRLMQTTCMRHLQPSRRTEQRLQRRRPPSCVLRWTVWWMSSDSTKWQREWQRQQHSCSCFSRLAVKSLIPSSQSPPPPRPCFVKRGNPSEVLVVLQPLEDTSNNFLVSSTLSFLSFVSLFCLNLCLWL